jgi:hypothetical protein
MSESIKYEELRNNYKPIVYVIQELPGTKMGAPKINIMSASKYGEFKFLTYQNFLKLFFHQDP